MIEEVIAELREISPRYEEDRSLSSDIRRVAAIVDHGAYCEARFIDSAQPAYMSTVFRHHSGDLPLLISVPHDGRRFPTIFGTG